MFAFSFIFNGKIAKWLSARRKEDLLLSWYPLSFWGKEETRKIVDLKHNVEWHVDCMQKSWTSLCKNLVKALHFYSLRKIKVLNLWNKCVSFPRHLSTIVLLRFFFLFRSMSINPLSERFYFSDRNLKLHICNLRIFLTFYA